ncbi:MAG TPA: ATP-dependent helicase [Bacteroidota bacterium]|nr:ATP-dependent helicase [Bacteroidota bacterium]
MSTPVVFGADKKAFLDYLKSRSRARLQKIVVSKTPAKRYRIAPGAETIAIFQDLPVDSAELKELTEKIVYPAWFKRLPIAFFSRPLQQDYCGKRVTSDYLHVDCSQVEAQLLREQLVLLLTEGEAHRCVRRAGTGRAAPGGSGDSTALAHVEQLDADLDASQRLAVQHRDGPMRVLAAAGSGKTKTLINRIAALVGGGVPPRQILPLAFNKKAEVEMNTRLRSRGLNKVRARTFHSLGYAIIKQATGLRFSLDDQTGIAGSIIRQSLQEAYCLDADASRKPSIQCAQLIRQAKTDLRPLSEMRIDLGGRDAEFAPVFGRFLELQKERRFINFDDMIYLALRELIDNDALRKECRQKWTYVLVDEFQDLNQAQTLLLYVLALPRNNLFVVGDDDQMIYGWRGASVRHIIEFPRRYSGARTCTLSTNYRSAERIVDHSAWLIAHNRSRMNKAIAARESAPRGEIEIQLHGGIWSEALAVARWLCRARCTLGGAWKDFAVLYRTNALQFPLALAMDLCSVPHAASDLSELFNTAPGRDVGAYFRVILDPENADAKVLRRVLTHPRRLLDRERIGKIDSLKDLAEFVASDSALRMHSAPLAGFPERIVRLRACARDLGVQSFELLRMIDDEFHLRSSYDGKAQYERDMDEADDKTSFDVILSLAEGTPSPVDFLQLCTSGPAAKSHPETAEDAVVLSTIHKTKGNEFDTVVYFDLSGAPGTEVEEERRVAYVAITRARSRVLITSRARKQSPFLRETILRPQFSARDTEDLSREKKILGARSIRIDRRIERLSRGHSSPASPVLQFLGHAWRSRDAHQMSRRLERADSLLNSLRAKHDKLSERIEALEREMAFRRALSPALLDGA